MADDDCYYGLRNLTLCVNAASLQEAAILAMSHGGDFAFPGQVEPTQDEDDRRQAERDQNILLNETPSPHAPGGYFVSVTRWAILDDKGKEVDADYIVTGVEDRLPLFSNPDIVSDTEAYISWVTEGRMSQEICRPEETNEPAAAPKPRL